MFPLLRHSVVGRLADRASGSSGGALWSVVGENRQARAQASTRSADRPAMDGLASVQARISAIEARFANSRASGRLGSSSAADFEASLNRATAVAAQPSLPSDDQPATTDLGQPGAGLVTYLNGRIPTTALTPIDQTGHLLSPPAARAFEQMARAAEIDGVSIGVNDAYRSIEEQRTLAKLKGLYSEGGLAAAPGTSAHGWGLAVDLSLDDAAHSWMQDHASQYGFVNDVPRERWHWTYRPESATSSAIPDATRPKR